MAAKKKKFSRNGCNSNNRPCNSLRSSGPKRKCENDDGTSYAKKGKNVKNQTVNIPFRMFQGKPGDMFCWNCHLKTDEFYCQNCPRTYHRVCLKKQRNKECECQLTSVDVNEPNIKLIPDLGDPLELALKVVEKEYIRKKTQIDLYKYLNFLSDQDKNEQICHEVVIEYIIDNIKQKVYMHTNDFYLDVKWMTHNISIHKGNEDKMAKIAKKFEKDVKLHLLDLEACGECYKRKYEDGSHPDFFTNICSTPHTIVWAKLKGYPFWPAKCLRIVNGNADVRFFGMHNKSLIPLSQVYKISKENPGGNPKKSKHSTCSTSYESSMLELDAYIKNYEYKCGTFHYFDIKTPLV